MSDEEKNDNCHRLSDISPPQLETLPWSRIFERLHRHSGTGYRSRQLFMNSRMFFQIEVSVSRTLWRLPKFAEFRNILKNEFPDTFDKT